MAVAEWLRAACAAVTEAVKAALPADLAVLADSVAADVAGADLPAKSNQGSMR